MIECSVERSKVIRRRAEGSPESLITPVKKGAVDKTAIEEEGSRIGQPGKVSV